jgi:two-component system sensor histidine kinase VicK
MIAIEDHGPGIPASLQPFIFQKFVQSRKHQVHNLPSTGLGLTIVKYITEAHGGKIYFESDRNKGTTFFLELPISASDVN